MQKQKYHHTQHIPVLLEDVLKCLKPKKGETYLDLTAGYGGHSQAVLDVVGDASKLTLVDTDEQAIRSLVHFKKQGTEVIHGDFLGTTKMLLENKRTYDMILLDLGVSSPQLDIPSRGFTFRETGPIDMRMDQGQSQSAYGLVNSLDEEELANILYKYGEERNSRRIAAAIVEARPIENTLELADIVRKVTKVSGKIDPATRTFQAIRIATNDELNQLKNALPHVLELLAPGGRLAVISFHSLEDRIVKEFLKEHSQHKYEAELELMTKKPISGATEDVNNPRARSAKLRAAVKINKKKGE